MDSLKDILLNAWEAIQAWASNAWEYIQGLIDKVKG